MSEPDYIDDLRKIRATYVSLLPRQRLHIIRQRLANPTHGPNLLVTHVSAVEGLARSLVMGGVATSQAELASLYSKYRDRDPEDLVGQYLSQHGHNSPKDFFGSDIWQKFGYAVSYRNMIVHECTYLGQDKFPYLEAACQAILDKLCVLAGLSVEA